MKTEQGQDIRTQGLHMGRIRTHWGRQLSLSHSPLIDPLSYQLVPVCLSPFVILLSYSLAFARLVSLSKLLSQVKSNWEIMSPKLRILKWGNNMVLGVCVWGNNMVSGVCVCVDQPF